MVSFEYLSKLASTLQVNYQLTDLHIQVLKREMLKTFDMAPGFVRSYPEKSWKVINVKIFRPESLGERNTVVKCWKI